MPRALLANRPALALLRGKRTEEALALWVAEFAGGDRTRSEAYLTSLGLFLGEPSGDATRGEWQRYVGSLSPRTRESYAFALNEFFEFVANKRGRVVPPHEITQADADAYRDWLVSRPFGLQEEKLKDGAYPERLAIYSIVKRLGTATIGDVEAALPSDARRAFERERSPGKVEFDLGKLHTTLGRMVLHDVLARTPTMAEMRAAQPSFGITEDYYYPDPDNDPARKIPLMAVFTYSMLASKPVSRTTLLNRLAALAAFWRVLLNVTGTDGQPVVKSDVWYVSRKRSQRGAEVEVRQAAAKQRIDPRLVARMLRQADRAHTISELRDKACLYLLAFVGLRVTELCQLRRGEPQTSDRYRWGGWLVGGEPPMLLVLQKGGKEQLLPYPPVALKALHEFQSELERQCPSPGMQHENPDGENYLPPNSYRWRYLELVMMPSAPLIPPLYLWGANSEYAYQQFKPNPRAPNTRGPFSYTHSMTRQAIRALLQRIAKAAGFTDSEARQAHPHALRHFALSAMVKEGKNIREVQAIAGHASMQTTEGYLEEPMGPVALSGQTEILRHLAQFEVPEEAPAAEPAPRRAARREVVETTAVAVPEPSRPAVQPGPERTRYPEPSRSPVLQAAERSLRDEPSPLRAALGAREGAVEAAVPNYVLPVAPRTEEPAAAAMATGAGQAVRVGDRIVALDGEPPTEERDEPDEVQLINDKSAGGPDYVYEAMETAQAALDQLAKARDASDKREARRDIAAAKLEPVEFAAHRARSGDSNLATIGVAVKEKTGERTEYVQGNKWLAEHYDPWPLHYGIGNQSLLPWFSKESTNEYGYVNVQDHNVPPIPVLSSAQVSPETKGGAEVLASVERIYERWLTGNPDKGLPPSPSRTYGLVRWYGFLAFSAHWLQEYLARAKRRVNWTPWDGVAKLGEDVRCHRNDWIESWLLANAHTYTTAERAFAQVPRGKSLVAAGEESAFSAAFNATAFRGIDRSATVPDWFAELDPIASLDPVEYDSFAGWLANVTGQRVTGQRRKDRDTQEKQARGSLETRDAQIKGLLQLYYQDVDAMEEAQRERRRADAKQLKESLALLARGLHELGVPDPQSEPFTEIADRDDRITALVKDWYKRQDAAELAPENMFADSKLFDPDLFKLDRMHHTISHDPTFAREFTRQYGQDSELLARRTARAMWEYVKERKLQEKAQLTTTNYNYLHSIMLCYLSWVVPAPDAMERRMAETGRTGLPPREARKQWLEAYMDMTRQLIHPEVPSDIAEADLVERYRQERGMDVASAEEAAVAARLIQEVHIEAEQAGTAKLGGMAELIGGEELRGTKPGGYVFAPLAAEEERREKRRKEKLEPNARFGARLIRNGRGRQRGARIIGTPGERVRLLYRVNLDGDLAPNPKRVLYLTLNALEESRAVFADARRLLPSPFAMIRAMTS